MGPENEGAEPALEFPDPANLLDGLVGCADHGRPAAHQVVDEIFRIGIARELGGERATGRLTADAGASWPVGDGGDVVRKVTAIAREGGWTPAQVALPWLRTRRGTVLPLLGATTPQQPADNIDSTKVVLGADQLAQLNEVSMPTLGFPHDLVRTERIIAFAYGDRWREVDDRRTTVRRAPNDALDAVTESERHAAR